MQMNVNAQSTLTVGRGDLQMPEDLRPTVLAALSFTIRNKPCTTPINQLASIHANDSLTANFMNSIDKYVNRSIYHFSYWLM